jgi:hypothetical protein
MAKTTNKRGSGVESYFSYPITRKYPFWWFTPVAILLLIFTPALTVIYFASTGYELVAQMSPDPNTTVGKYKDRWYVRLAAVPTDSLEPHGDPATIPVNSQFFTNQSGLTYTLLAVNDTLDGPIGTLIPALPYYNNLTLQNCNVSVIQIDLDHLDRTPNQVIAADWGMQIYTRIFCIVADTHGTYELSFRGSYDFLTDDYSLLTGSQQFVAIDPTSRAAFWWGESLLSAWWINVSSTMIWTYGVHTASPGDMQKEFFEWVPWYPAQDVTDLDAFGVTWHYITNPLSDGSFQSPANGSIYHPIKASTAIQDGHGSFPNGSTILYGMDRLARVMYSTILIDLGQPPATSKSNILLNPDLLTEFSNVTFSSPGGYGVNPAPFPAGAGYANLTASGHQYHLTFSPSSISTTYFCQVPKIKSPAYIVLSVLVADLVFLQTVWQIYCFIVGLVLSGDAKANWCDGCKNK